jgi:outer membrane protein
MNIMLRYSLALITIALAAEPVSGNDLRQLYQLALTRDTTLQAARFQRDAAIEARPQAWSQLFPQLFANAAAERERKGLEASGQAADQNGCTASATVERCTGIVRGYGLNLTQTLWSFEAFSRLKEASFQAASAEATFQAAQQALVLRVAQAYFRILAAEDQVTTNRSERQAFGTLLEQARVRAQTGVGPRSDVAQAQAFYDSTEQSVIDAQNALDDANLALAEIVGTYVEDIAPLRDDITPVSPEPASVNEWVASARRDNPAVRAAELNIEAALRDISVQRGKGLPTVSLTGSTSQLWENSGLGGNQTLDTVGVSLNWPLFQGGAVASSLRQSRALYRQAQAEYETALRQTEMQTRAAFRGVVTGIQRIAAARRATESEQAAVEAGRHNVEFGTGTEFDLLNAQNNYSSALRAYSQTRYDYLANLLSLKQQAGRIGEGDLEAIDELLVAHKS